MSICHLIWGEPRYINFIRLTSRSWRQSQVFQCVIILEGLEVRQVSRLIQSRILAWRIPFHNKWRSSTKGSEKHWADMKKPKQESNLYYIRDCNPNEIQFESWAPAVKMFHKRSTPKSKPPFNCINIITYKKIKFIFYCVLWLFFAAHVAQCSLKRNRYHLLLTGFPRIILHSLSIIIVLFINIR